MLQRYIFFLIYDSLNGIFSKKKQNSHGCSTSEIHVRFILFVELVRFVFVFLLNTDDSDWHGFPHLNNLSVYIRMICVRFILFVELVRFVFVFLLNTDDSDWHGFPHLNNLSVYIRMICVRFILFVELVRFVFVFFLTTDDSDWHGFICLNTNGTNGTNAEGIQRTQHDTLSINPCISVRSVFVFILFA